MKDMEVQFGNLETGERFFDPVSGEFWEKWSSDTAMLITGSDQGGKDHFQDHEIVVVQETPRLLR